ncbi:hypothetical protein U1Q18_023790, partial [Sarracenia purpurea var. burkii]
DVTATNVTPNAPKKPIPPTPPPSIRPYEGGVFVAGCDEVAVYYSPPSSASRDPFGFGSDPSPEYSLVDRVLPRSQFLMGMTLYGTTEDDDGCFASSSHRDTTGGRFRTS